MKEVTEIGEEETIFFVSGKVIIEIGKRKNFRQHLQTNCFSRLWNLLTNKNSFRREQIFLEIDHSKFKGHELKPRVIESSETKIAIKCSWCFRAIVFQFCFKLTSWIWKVLWTGKETLWIRKKLPLKVKCPNWKIANDTELILLVKV